MILGLLGAYFRKKKAKSGPQFPATSKQLLLEHVPFYAALDSGQKAQFETRVTDFLETVSIRGIDTEAEELDKVLIAAGAIMLLFSFPDWKYNNLNEVLLYKDTFNKEYETDGADRSVLGMVGDGAMHRMMLISRPSLRASFAHGKDGHNTILHEFAHLIDKADGVVDGMPEYLLDRPYLAPWAKHMHATIQEMISRKSPDINIYGATNEAEFFAVVTEYFFERPKQLQENHPELYDMLELMYRPGKMH
ncbi:MAG: M90 family metallopeptidase [Bacteroidota bacterium]